MGLLSRFENKMEDGIESTVGSIGSPSISPVQIMKRAEKEMRREKIVGAGRQYAPTLYTVLVSQKDDDKMASFYPTLAGETETYLVAKAREMGCVMDGAPLVRFLVDPNLRKGKFDVVAELVASPIIAQLRDDENRRYGIGPAHAGTRRPIASGIPQERNMQPNLQPLHNLGDGYDEFEEEDDFVQGVDGNPAQGAGSAVAGQQPGGSASADFPNVRKIVDNPSDLRPMTAQEMGVPEMIASQTNEVRPQSSLQAQPAEPRRQSLDIDAYIKESNLREVYLYDEERDIAYQLSEGRQRIGRESKNEIVVPDINISRSHAQIERRPDGSWVITDMGSTNGLYVNGIKVRTAILRDADVITIGTTDLEFQLLE